MIETVIDPGLFNIVWTLVGIGWCFIIASWFMRDPKIFADGISWESVAQWEKDQNRRFKVVIIGFGFQFTGLFIAIIARWVAS